MVGAVITVVETRLVRLLGMDGFWWRSDMMRLERKGELREKHIFSLFVQPEITSDNVGIFGNK